MATLTLTVPEDMKKGIEESKIVDWSAVAREAIRERLAQLRIVKAIAAKSKLTEEEALEFSIMLGRKVNAGIHKRHLEKYGA